MTRIASLIHFPRVPLMITKGKYQQDLFKNGTAKDEMVEAATRFGLDSKLAARLSIKNLSTVIAVAQFRTA